jgi:hypothetical protein
MQVAETQTPEERAFSAASSSRAEIALIRRLRLEEAAEKLILRRLGLKGCGLQPHRIGNKRFTARPEAAPFQNCSAFRALAGYGSRTLPPT